MGLGTGLMKTLMFVFNGIVWILGVVLFVVGIVVLVEGQNWNDIIDNKTVPVSVMLIVVGLVIAIVGFLGCFGAMKQNGGMLLLYAIVLGVIIIVQCVAGILAFVFSDESEEMIEKSFDEVLAQYTGSADKSMDHAFNVIMEEFECCGITGPADFKTKTDADQYVQANVPDSCCSEMESQCGWDYWTKQENGEQVPEIRQEGCLTKTVDYVKSNMKIVGAICLAFMAIEFFQIVFAMCLRKNSNGLLA